MYDIRPANAQDMALLPMVEAASDSLLAGVNGTALGAPLSRLLPGASSHPEPAAASRLPPGASSTEIAASLKVLVAGRPCIGFARLEELDGLAHLEQLSVLPEYAGRGVGRSLIEASLTWARSSGYSWMTLCTFADVPFNAPFYTSCGFRIINQPSGALKRLREHEADLGLDILGRRVAMRAQL